MFPAGATPNIQESWYAYDKLNRVVVNDGVLENGQVVAAKNFNYSSYGVSYDAAGNAENRGQSSFLELRKRESRL